MNIAKTLFLLLLALPGADLSAQCPDQPALQARIFYLRDSLRSPADLQLKELLDSREAMKKCRYDHDSVYALLLRRIGTLYFSKGEFTRAVEFTRAAIDALHEKDNHPAYQGALANCYSNLSLYYDSLGLTMERNDARDNCILRSLTLPDSLDVRILAILFRRVDDLFNSGDYYNCIYYAELANSLHVKSSGATLATSINILNDKLNALNFLKKYDRSRQELAGREMEYLQSRNPQDQGNLYSIKANIAKGEGDYPLALRYFQQAFTIHSRAQFPQGCAQTLNDMGFIYLSNLRDPVRSLSYFRAALSYHDPVELLNILDNLANAHVRLRQYDSAFFYFQLGLDQWAPGLQEENLFTLPMDRSGNVMAYLVELLLNKADACLETGRAAPGKARPGAVPGKNSVGEELDKARIAKAISLYKITDKLLDRVRSGQAETGSQLFWRADNHRLYDRAIEACYIAGSQEDAFYFFEKSRAVLLNDRLLELSQASPDDLLQQGETQKKIQTLEKELTTVQRASPRTVSPRTAALQDELFRSRQQLHILLGNVRRRDPSRQPGMKDPDLLRLQDLQKMIGSQGQSLLELFAGDSALYTFTLTTSGMRMARIGRAHYDSLSREYISGLTHPPATRTAVDSHFSIARQLYRALFPENSPVPAHTSPAPALISPAPARIIISPDGNYFPFEALVTNREGQPPRYFVEDHAVSYTYSASYLLNVSKALPPPPTGADFLGIAPVRYASDLHLPELTGSDFSLQTLRANFSGGEALIGRDATLRNFQLNFLKYRILQLYTHATSSSANGSPLIFFADSALSLPDLISVDKPVTRLVVLSACETANGEFYQGEGIFSFNRRFATLGIPASVANLWSVENTATYRLTELFYKYLSEGDPTDIALQRAKKEFLQQVSGERRLPYYWAAPVLTGNVAVLATRSPGWISGWGGCLLVLAIGAIAIILYLAFRIIN